MSKHPTRAGRLNLALDPETRQRLERLAARNRRSISAQVAVLVDEATISTAMPVVLTEEQG